MPLKRTTSLKKVPFKRKAGTSLKRPATKRTRAKKASKQSILRGYGLPDKYTSSQLRYKQPIERGILWYWFSRFIRERDKHLPCISCGNHKPDMQGGHFIPAGSCSIDDMVFSELNVHAECAFCNLRDKAKLKYARNLDLKNGPGSAQALRDYFNEYKYSGNTYKNWSRVVYIEKINRYRSIVAPSQTPNPEQ